MAIKVGGTTVIDDSRQLSNITSVDATTVAALGTAGVGGASSINGLSDAFSDGTSIAFGPDALAVDRNRNLDNSSTNNIAIGQNSLASSTSGNQNVCIGYNTGNAGTTLGTNVFIGAQSGRLSNGSANVCVGPYTGYSLSGYHESNTFIGMQAGFMSDSDANTAVGRNAMLLATSATANAALGNNSLSELTTGLGNTAVGYEAADNITTGGNNTCIGYEANASSATVSNEFTLGNSSIGNLRCADQSISGLSDARDKTNVENLDAGLDFVRSLRPVSFDWNTRDGAKVGIPDTGFIAQELSSAQENAGVSIPRLVTNATNANGDEQFEAAYTRLIPSLVLAIKELSAKVETLEAQLQAQG